MTRGARLRFVSRQACVVENEATQLDLLAADRIVVRNLRRRKAERKIPSILRERRAQATDEREPYAHKFHPPHEHANSSRSYSTRKNFWLVGLGEPSLKLTPRFL